MKKMCRVSARRLSIYIFVWGLLKATKNFPKKSMFKYLKSVKEPKIRMGTEFAGLTQNPKKITGIPNLPIKKKITRIPNLLIKKKIFPKKVCLVP
jgi:hypothetical protein